MLSLGTVDISPVQMLPLFGYSNRSDKATIQPNSLEANWALFEDGNGKLILLLSIDSLFSSSAFEEAIHIKLSHFGISIAHLFVVASHTHYAPALDPTKSKLGEAFADYIDYVASEIAKDIKHHWQGESSIVLKKWYFAETCVDLSVFRRALRFKLQYKKKPFVSVSMSNSPNCKVEIDKSLKVWAGVDSKGEMKLFVVSWSCHATSRNDPNVISSDYIASIREAIRDIHGANSVVLYLPGMCGDIRPNFARLGRGLSLLYPYPFQRAFQAPTKAQESEFDRELRVKTTNCLENLTSLMAFETSSYYQVSVSCNPVLTVKSLTQLNVTHLNFGGLKVVGLNAEPSSKWNEILPEGFIAKSVILTGYVGACFGYLPTREQLYEGGYEVDGFRDSFGFEPHYNKEADLNGFVLDVFDT